MTSARLLRRAPTALAALAILATALLLAGCGSGSDNGSGTGDAATAPTASPSGECSYPTTGSAARKVRAPSGTPTTKQPVRVSVRTNRGAIPITLSADKTPCTVNSFLSLARQGYFDKTPCHRLTTAGIYVLQCGDPTGTGSGGPGYRFPDELLDDDPRLQPCKEMPTSQGKTKVCTYPAGTVAMANAGPDTNGSQFFLVYRDSSLPPAYTVFGRMTAQGLKTVRGVARAGVSGGTSDGSPAKSVTIKSVQLPTDQSD